MKKAVLSILVGMCIMLMALPAMAAQQKSTVPSKGKILFVPHDNRPVSDSQTVDTIRSLGYEVIVPPDKLLGNRTDIGHPDELWAWTEKNIKDVDAAVISADSMLYGSLVASRKHNFDKQEVLDRAEKFVALRKENPKGKLYVFASIMRTPRSGANSGTEEPSYYASYGEAIFRYTALADKEDMGGLTYREKKEFAFLIKLIPKPAIRDWMSRRSKNFAANERLIQLTRDGVFDYFSLGRDDNAPYSQTHMESRKLAAEGADLSVAQFQAMAGIDEFGMLMLTRAVNDHSHMMPFILVRYNIGKGANTIPSYSDEKISNSIRSHIIAAGGMQVSTSKRADLILLVNTNMDGKTSEANERANTEVPRENTVYFANLVEESVKSGIPVGVGDIAYANGADNALMAQLEKKGLLYKLASYAGWNTATNSTGFVLGQGIMAAHMSQEDHDRMLTMRYLDDWGYEANVRQELARQLSWLSGKGDYADLDKKKMSAETLVTKKMRYFAASNLPPFAYLKNLQVTFPWDRMFEARFDF